MIALAVSGFAGMGRQMLGKVAKLGVEAID